MSIIPIFVILFIVASVWDVGRVNRSIGATVNPSPSKQEMARRRQYEAWLSAHR